MTDSLSLFQDNPLLSEPGTTYHYTTHGWTLLSAVIEGAAKQDFLKYMKQLFKDLGMDNTCAEFNDDIIHNRARCLVYVLFSCSIHTVEFSNEVHKDVLNTVVSEVQLTVQVLVLLLLLLC